MFGPTSSKRHPLESLALLVGLAVAGGVIFTVLALVAAKAIYPDTNMLDAIQGLGPNSIGYLKLIQIFSTIGTFIVPALFFGWLESGSPSYYLKLNSFPILLGVLAIVILFAAYPLLDLSVTLNKQMKLPESLHWMEEWMRQKEDEMAALTKQLLSADSPAGLAVNLLMIAILPAIGEEFIFRGCLQNTVWRWTKNYHLAIWITAFVFSAIHVQFLGFLPRMLLGALLGYLLVWGRSIWLPILAHFTNNATSVIAAYIYQKNGQPLDKLDQPQTTNPIAYIASLFITGFLLWQFYRWHKGRIKEEEEIYETDGERLD
ncbi:MAG: Abortive infection protein [Sphingobacteriaceae bacterium]|jgi:membrane protease YdiL (CAAX protease family)|nr:Abortive infection protein [Sphingobacteriaceae bacterium]